MKEKTPTPGFEDGEQNLLNRIYKVREENFSELFENSVDFIPVLMADVEREFPNEPQAWNKVLAYHRIIGSTMPESREGEISTEAKKYVETKISDFIKSFED